MTERPILFTGEMVRAIFDRGKTQTRRLAEPRLQLVPRRKVTADALPWQSRMEAERIAIAPPHRYRATIGRAGAVCAVYGADLEDDRLGVKPGEFDFLCPYASGRTYLDDGWRIDVEPDQRLWVRETAALYSYPQARTIPFSEYGGGRNDYMVQYRAGYPDARIQVAPPERWTPGIHVPRWASRLTLGVTQVRLQRLQDITEADAAAEGVLPFHEAYKHVGTDQRIACHRTGTVPDRHYPDFLAREAPYRASYAVLWDTINGDRVLWVDNPWVWAVTFKVHEIKERVPS